MAGARDKESWGLFPALAKEQGLAAREGDYMLGLLGSIPGPPSPWCVTLGSHLALLSQYSAYGAPRKWEAPLIKKEVVGSRGWQSAE